MNRRLTPPSQPELRFEFNGEPVVAYPGDTLASALLAAGVDIFARSIKYHRPRGPYCLSGRCSHCLVRVDGVPDVMACTTPVAAGMRVVAQNAYPSAKHDVLAAIDWLFPKSLDHHALFAGVPLVEGAMAKVARHLAGLGPLPDSVRGPAGRCARRHAQVAIVGAGPAGLSCAQALRGAGLSVEVIEERPRPGGRLLAGLNDTFVADSAWIEQVCADCQADGMRLSLGATVLAVYLEEGSPVLALAEPGGLALLKAERVAFCTGAIEPLEPFANNDLPGIFAGRGLARLIRQQRVLPGQRAVVVGSCDEALALAHLLALNGARVEALVDPEGRLNTKDFRVLSGFAPVQALGHGTVRGLTVAAPEGAAETLECNLVALCPLPAPAFELPRQAGAAVSFCAEKGGYCVQADANGSTRAEAVFVAGDVTGYTTVAGAREAGQALGSALAGRREPPCV